MSAVPVAERMTAEEFLASPEPELGWPRSLVDGEVIMNDSAPLHNHVHTDLLVALATWAQARSARGRVMLPLDVQLDERNVFKPDILWYAEGRAPARDAQPPSPMPDLAVEVRSPSTWRYDIGAKKRAYEHYGLPGLWLVDTAAEAVVVFRRSKPDGPTFDLSLELSGAEELASPLLPGFALAVDKLFPRE